MVTRDDAATIETDAQLRAVMRAVRRARLSGPERAQVWEAVGTAREKAVHGHGLAAARLLYGVADRDETPAPVAELLRSVAPRFLEIVPEGGRLA